MGYLPTNEFQRVNAANLEWEEKLPLIAQMARLNTLFSIKRAGSGHIGSSFSALDIVVYLYYRYLNISRVGIHAPQRDLFFSSKGHDAPGHYAVLYSLGILNDEMFLNLRRFGGLEGHPDIETPGIEANTGSLGMGISKARGMDFAKRHLNLAGKVVVMTGDGEFQEGQNFEALQSTVHQGRNNLVVVMDHNKLQSDRPVDRINSLRELETKISSFGWAVLRCDGHDFRQLAQAFQKIDSIHDKPKFLVCDTIKGRGVHFMEHSYALAKNEGYYPWHAGAPDDTSYEAGIVELTEAIEKKFQECGLSKPHFIATEPKTQSPSIATKRPAEFIADAYGKALLNLANELPKFFVLDADLSLDCRVREFEKQYPHRFIEMGIAEQDMVSMASGMALQGLLPICHSFANFLAARANEQIYNALSEKRKIIFACHYAGLIPAGPGKSHQAIRDISLFGAFPEITILQPCHPTEVHAIVRYAIQEAQESCMIRLNIGPSPEPIPIPPSYQLKKGQGTVLCEGHDNALFAYGPVMLNEALNAQKQLTALGVSLKVINMPWLNRFDKNWLEEVLKECHCVSVLDDHSPVGGLGDHLLSFLNDNGMLNGRRFTKWGVEGFPVCGTPSEALKAHRLDSQSLVERFLEKNQTLHH